MKRLIRFLVLLCISSAAYSSAKDVGIIGKFEMNMSKPGSSLGMRLECENETTCKLITNMTSKQNPPTQNIQVLKKINPVENLVYASNALKYAIERRSNEMSNDENREMMKHLGPVLSTNPTVSKCWDLNYPETDYMLACAFSGNSSDKPTIYLFITLLANCDEAFCRFVIWPMTQVK